MITNFEEITSPLTKEELKFVPVVIKELKNRKKKNPIKAKDIVDKINIYSAKTKKMPDAPFTDSKLRKVCNFLRSNGILPVIATSNGYFVSYKKNEIELQILSLKERASAILSSAKGLKKFI